MFKIVNGISSFSFVLRRVVRFFPITFRVIYMFMSKATCRPSQTSNRFMFAIPFKNYVKILSLLLLTFRRENGTSTKLKKERQGTYRFARDKRRISDKLNRWVFRQFLAKVGAKANCSRKRVYRFFMGTSLLNCRTI